MNEFRWVFHRDLRIAELALAGEVTTAALQTAHQRLAACPDWRRDWQILMSAGSDTRLEALTLPALRLHQSYILGWNLRHRAVSEARTALVCSDAVRLSIAHLWETVNRLDSATQVAAFDDRDRALEWLRPGVAGSRLDRLGTALAD